MKSVVVALLLSSKFSQLKQLGKKMEEASIQDIKNISLDEEAICVGYEGDYRKEKRHGNGSYKHKDGSVYCGEWRCNLKNGFGRMCHPDGSRYEGEWKKNLKHGFGIYVYANGDNYEGQWYNGMRHGIGTYTHVENDCSFYGTWKKGQRIGPAEIRTENYRFHTMWKYSKPAGMAAFTFKCNTMMTGYMHTESSDQNICNTGDFKWYTKTISKYDRSKLPQAPILQQVNDKSDNESFDGSMDESDGESTDDLNTLYEDNDEIDEEIDQRMN